MSRLTDNSSFPGLQDALLRFWNWWRGELAEACSPFLRLAMSRRASGPSVRLMRSHAGDDIRDSALSVDLSPESWAALAGELGSKRRAARPLVLHVADELVLRRRTRYPAGAVSRLDDIVALDIEKATPFSRQSSLWKWRIVERGGGEVDVETVILRRDLVLSALSLASRQGLVVGEIVCDVPGGSGSLSLMRLETPADRSRIRWRRVNAGLAAVLLLLAAGNAGLAFWQRGVALEEVTARLEDAKTRAIRLRRAQADAIADFDASVALLREKAQTPSVNAVWEALSRTLPETVFLSALEISGKTGRISGFATSAAPLIELLEGQDLLSDVAFASPVMINPDDRLERFDITFRLRPGRRDLAAVSAPAGEGAQ